MNNILVGNLGPGVTEIDIRPLFEKHGKVDRFKMMTDRGTGLSRGFGFVEMRTDAEAVQAIVALNGANVNGTVLKVSQARLQLNRRNRVKQMNRVKEDRKGNIVQVAGLLSELRLELGHIEKKILSTEGSRPCTTGEEEAATPFIVRDGCHPAKPVATPNRHHSQCHARNLRKELFMPTRERIASGVTLKPAS